MRIFLDTSVLSDQSLPKVSDELIRRRLAGDEFHLSAVTHFQVMWGYLSAGLSSRRYERLLEMTEIGISPVTRPDAEEAARMKPGRGDLLDAFIAAAVKRHDASIWTSDRDFLKFLPKARVKLI